MRAPGGAGVVVAVLACLIIGCAGGGSDNGSDGGGPKPPTCTSQVPGDPISYDNNIAPILSQSCGLAGCHVPPIVNAGLDLTPAKAYDQMVGVDAAQVRMKRIKPGDPDNSYVLLKILPDAPIQGVIMPNGCPGTPVAGPRCLLPDEIEAFRTWILECAPRN